MLDITKNLGWGFTAAISSYSAQRPTEVRPQCSFPEGLRTRGEGVSQSVVAPRHGILITNCFGSLELVY